MKFLLLALVTISCAHHAPSEEEDLVSVPAALNQAQASYLKGCVDALHDIKIPIAFEGCRDKAIVHRRELNELMNQEIKDENFRSMDE